MKPLNSISSPVIKGFDIATDPSVQTLCQTYNESSGSTRSVLYVLLVVCLIGLVSAFNAYGFFSWTDDKLLSVDKDIQHMQTDISRIKKNSDTSELSSMRDALAQMKLSEQLYTKARIETESINLSAIDSSIEVRDLSSIFGFIMVVVLFILRFSLLREKNNLKIALIAINERYPDDANQQALRNSYQLEHSECSYGEKEWSDIISKINYLRRKFHYNFLSMNEVFTLPYLDSSNNIIQKKRTGKWINRNLFYVIVPVYSTLIFFDFYWIESNRHLNRPHTNATLSLLVFLYCFVFDLCQKCVDQKRAVFDLYTNFWQKKYTYDYGEYRLSYSLIRTFAVSLSLLLILFLISKSHFLALIYG